MMHWCLDPRRTAHLLGFVPGAEVEFLDRNGDVVATTRMDDDYKARWTVPWNVTKRRFCRDERRSYGVSVYYIRACATGAVVDVTPSLHASSGMIFTVGMDKL